MNGECGATTTCTSCGSSRRRRLLARVLAVLRDRHAGRGPARLSTEAISSGEARTNSTSPAGSTAPRSGCAARTPSRSHSTTLETRRWKRRLKSAIGLADPARLGLDDRARCSSGRAAGSRASSRRAPALAAAASGRATCRRSPSTTSATPIGVMPKMPSAVRRPRSQQVVSEQERRRAEERQRGAERGGERHRHQQPRWRQVLLAREAHHDRQHHRRDHQVVRERRERGDRRHDHQDRAPFAARRPPARSQRRCAR